MKVFVASKNPVKREAVRLGFLAYFPEVDLHGISVESGVSDQPFSDEETYLGATNRAEGARLLQPGADYWVGIEGGIEERGDGICAFAWIVIIDKYKTGKSRTTSFQLPAKVVELLHQGYELGVANDILFKKENSKQKSGAVGILTHDAVSRTELYKQAVQLALIPFLNAGWY